MMMRMYMMRLLMNTSRKSSIKILRQTPHHSRVHTNTTHFIVIQHLFGFDSLLSRLNGKSLISMNCKQRLFLWTIFFMLGNYFKNFLFWILLESKKKLSISQLRNEFAHSQLGQFRFRMILCYLKVVCFSFTIFHVEFHLRSLPLFCQKICNFVFLFCAL